MDGFELFLKCLKDINDPQSVNEANEKLSALMQENTALYLTYASQVILNFCEEKENKDIIETENDVVVSLSAIRNACTPNRTTSIKEIRNCWQSDDPISNQMRPLVLRAILICITNPSISIRKMSCAALASVLLVDKDNLNEVIQTLLTSTSTTDPLNFGSVMMFLEIFNLNVIPSEIKFQEIDKDAYIKLLDIIFNILANFDQEIVDQSFKINASICLKKLIEKGSYSLFDSDLVEKILDIIFLVFSNESELSPDLYRELHYVMLKLIESLYEYSDNFCDKIFKITEIGFNDDNTSFKIISYNFWSLICKFEADFDSRLNITEHYVEELINYGIQLISSIDPHETYFLSDGEHETQSNEYVVNALSIFFGNLMRNAVFDTNFEKFVELIEEFLASDQEKNSESYIQQHYSAILIMRSFIFDHKYDYVFQFISDKIPYISEYAVSEVDFLSEASVKLLKELLKKYKEVFDNPDNITAIFKVIQICSRFTNDVNKKAIDLINVFCSKIDPDLLVNSNFDNLFQIFVEKFTDVAFLQSDGIFYLQRSFACFIRQANSLSNNKIMNLLKNFIQVAKAPFFKDNFGFVMPVALSVPDWDPTAKRDYTEDSLYYFSKDRFFLICIITVIIEKFFKLGIGEYISEFLDFLFDILQNQNSFLYCDCLRSTAKIIEIITSDFKPYVPNYVSVLNDCLFSENPQLIKISSFCLGNLCEYLQDSIGEEVRDIILKMFDLMITFDEFQQMEVINTFLSSFSKIVYSLRVYIVNEMDFLISLFNYSLALINFRVDLENKNEYEFAENLYISLCEVFCSIIAILPVDVFKDKSFTGILKAKLFLLFQQIELLHTQNLDLVLQAVKLIDVLYSQNNSHYNAYFYKTYMRKLSNWFLFNCESVYETKVQENMVLDVFKKIYERSKGESEDY